MRLIQQITTDALQKQLLQLSDGTTVSLTIYFISMQYGWFITELVYQSFTLNGLRITNSPNFLHQFRNKIPFGMACYTKGNREPTQLEDFSTGNSKLYLLSAAEVAQYARVLNGGV